LTYKSNLPYDPQLILVWLSHLNQLSPYLLSNINKYMFSQHYSYMYKGSNI